MTTMRHFSIRWSFLAGALVCAHLGFAEARAAGRETGSAGVVDGRAFADLARDEDSVVEVHLSGALLSTLASADSKDEGFGAFLRGLRSIEAYIVELGSDSARLERAERLVRDTEAKLDRQGWERIARVREKSSNVNILVRHDEPFIDGLVILVVDRESGDVVFANIAGRIDLARLGDLGRVVNLPGLDSLADPGDQPKSRGSKRPAPPPDKPDEAESD